MADEGTPHRSESPSRAKKNYVELVGPAPLIQREPGRQRIEERAAERRTVAVLVAHGMGSQVPFETLQLVADRLRGYAVPMPGTGMDVKVQLATLGKTQPPRAG